MTACGDAAPREAACPHPCLARQAWPPPARATMKRKDMSEESHKHNQILNSSNKHRNALILCYGANTTTQIYNVAIYGEI